MVTYLDMPHRPPKNWQELRRQAFARDNNQCQLAGPGCTQVATCVDHITPHALGGGSTLDNLRAACRHCNSSRGGFQGNIAKAQQARQRRMPAIGYAGMPRQPQVAARNNTKAQRQQARTWQWYLHNV